MFLVNIIELMDSIGCLFDGGSYKFKVRVVIKVVYFFLVVFNCFGEVVE